ncbi:MAG: beta-ketoacyl synthase chain length factor [Methylomonas sp.]
MDAFAALQSSSDEIRLSFTLKHWCLWQSTETAANDCWPGGEVLAFDDGHADVSFMPAIQSRRLSPLAMAACAVAWRCREAEGSMPVVFYSSHGESRYYFEMFDGMAAGEKMSPSRFSLCVHNAIAGLFSVQSQSLLPYVCLAGGSDSSFGSFLEAAGMLMEVPKVLVVWYEQPLPEAYRSYLAGSDTTWALAMALERTGKAGSQLHLSRHSAAGRTASESSDDSLVQSILRGQRSGCSQLERSLWQWSLDDA